MSKTKRETTVVKSLDDLGEAAKGIKLSIPTLRSLPSLSGLGEAVSDKVAAVRQIAEDVANALKFIRDAGRKVAGCRDRLERKIVASETEKPVADMRRYLGQVLGLDDKVLRSAAAIAYLKESVSQQFGDYEEARTMLADLTECGLLVQDSAGPVLIAYQHYKIGEAFGLDPDDITEVSEAIDKFSRVLMTLEKQRRQLQTKEMEAEADVDLDGVRDGENGKCLLHVPPESYIDKRGDGKEHWRGGGKVLLDFHEKDVIPIQASGSIEGLVAEMVRMGIQLGRHTLGWENPPGYGKAFERVAEGVRESLGLSHDEAAAYVRKLQSFWYLIRRGVKCFDEAKAAAESKKELASKAKITALQFFDLNGSAGQAVSGTALLEFRGTFKQQDGPSFFEPFFLATRGEGEDSGFFEVTEVPPHLQKFLGQYVGKKFSTSDDYRGCPEQLGRLIRAMRNQEEMAAATAQ